MCKWTIFIFLFFKNRFDLRLFVPLWLILVVLYFIHNKIMSTIKAATTSQTNCLLGCQVWSSSCLILEAVLEGWLFLFKSFPPDWLLFWLSYMLQSSNRWLLCKKNRQHNPHKAAALPISQCFCETTTAGPDFVDRRCKMQPKKIPNVANFTISLAQSVNRSKSVLKCLLLPDWKDLGNFDFGFGKGCFCFFLGCSADINDCLVLFLFYSVFLFHFLCAIPCNYLFLFVLVFPACHTSCRPYLLLLFSQTCV